MKVAELKGLPAPELSHRCAQNTAELLKLHVTALR
jgi:hypothetical protein